MGLKSKEACGDHPGAAASPPTELSKSPFTRQQQQQSESSLKCPRCGSDYTKFCYYNNYNKSQPRHFCKSCKRHWTHGGSLRNVPMGGGRKNKRPRTTRATTATYPTNSPITTIDSDNESMSRILYQTLIQSSTDQHETNNDMMTPDYKPTQNSNAVEESATLSNHESHLHPINDVVSDQYTDEMGPMMTTWPSLNMINGDMDISNCWNWSEIDEYAFTNSSDLNVAWDDVYWEAKP